MSIILERRNRKTHEQILFFSVTSVYQTSTVNARLPKYAAINHPSTLDAPQNPAAQFASSLSGCKTASTESMSSAVTFPCTRPVLPSSSTHTSMAGW